MLNRSSFELLPELHYFGVTQKRAPLAIREKIPTDRDSQLTLLSALSEFAAGRVVLATCERFEVYASGVRQDANAWTRFLSDWLRIPLNELAGHIELYSGRRVAEHLLRVAAGFESRILGEQQILGQVRNAHRNAQEQCSLDAQLSTLMRTAIRVGKRVRQETPLDCNGRSIATLAMDWLRSQGESLDGKTVSIIGSGRLAGLVASNVILQKPANLIFASRDPTRASLLAEQFHATCRDLTRLEGIIAESDLIFACTASRTFLIRPDNLRSRQKPVRLIDLCVPRNVDPAMAELAQVSLIHLDDLVSRETRIRAPLDERRNESALKRAEMLVAEELDGFWKWRQERPAAPLIADLLSRAAMAPCSTGRRDLHEQILRLKAGAVL